MGRSGEGRRDKERDGATQGCVQRHEGIVKCTVFFPRKEHEKRATSGKGKESSECG